MTLTGEIIADFLAGIGFIDVLAIKITPHAVNHRTIETQRSRRPITDRVNIGHIIAEVEIDAFIYLDVDEATITDRLLKRRVCKNCHANYHTESMPPKIEGICDVCGHELSIRKDDNPETIRKRWQVFETDKTYREADCQ